MNREGRHAGSLVLVAVVVSLVVALSSVLLAGRAQAQGDGQAGNVICVVGAQRGNETPIILVDGAEQSLMIYKYTTSGDDIELVAARSYRFDRLLKEYNIDGKTVDDIRALIRKQDD